jgi:hypothetical protein
MVLKVGVEMTNPFTNGVLWVTNLVSNIILMVLAICVTLVCVNDTYGKRMFNDIQRETALGEAMILMMIVLMGFSVVM